ncbi:hypothetical protein LQ318_14055 [Aliifodinibius salicampi]|uniref:Uncharacterized protein n=1 Tax=Fodinibius salicampi TaxID=1920655 RepID=A0ABT3Q1U9_9BACT|nr:hypothetical protein [Fodinibius salicampi]MCW9714031.1 hypothetical protein [Fodinibius salicampi]
MFNQYRIQLQYKTRQRQILNALLALATGILTLIYPNFLYLIAAGYLIGLGLLFMAFRIPATLSALPIVAGVLIFIFPELIPVTFAAFLGLFGFILLFGFQFALVGVLTLIIAILILMNPDSVAYLIATFLLLYSVSNLIRFYQNPKKGSGDSEKGPVSIQ